MKDISKTKKQLIAELEALRRHASTADMSAVKRRLAVERIRSQAMAMRQSGDLVKALGVMWEEMVALDTDSMISRFNIRFIEGDGEAARINKAYYTFPNPRKYGISWTSPSLVTFNEEVAVGEVVVAGPRDAKVIDAWRRGEVLSVPVSREEFERRLETFAENWGLDRPPPIEEAEKSDGIHIYVPFEHGIIGFRVNELREDHLTITRELTEVVSLGYIRYLDFHRLEEQNRVLEENMRLLRETQNQLLMQEKMASLGDIVAGVAHEMNTPLGAAKSMHDTLVRATERLRQALETDHPDAYRDTRAIQPVLKIMIDANRIVSEGVERVGGIVDSLRNFARLDEAEFQVVDLHSGIDSALILLERHLGEKITLRKNYGEIQPIHCSPGQLNQVFMHLLKNAIAAIEGAGEITISSFAANNQVCVRINDTGRGIPPDKLARIFDFGFRASGERMKMGLGLATDYRIVRDHQGEIQIESEVGRGTQVTVSLPTDPAAPASSFTPT